MSDDERRRLDETGEFDPFGDEDEIPSNGGTRSDDGTAPLPRADADADRTALFPALDDDATTVAAPGPQSDTTSVLPAARDDDTNTQRNPRGTDNWADDGESVWSARVGVRTPRYKDDATETDWAAVPADEPHGRWWTPIAVGIIALFLLGVLGWGIYLIAQSSGDSDGTPAVTASPAAPATTTTGSASRPPSTTPATTQPTGSPTPPPSDVTVPALRGLSTDEARAALDRKRLNYRLRFLTSDSPAGTVIDSDPAEGQQVPADTVITLIIAAPPNTSATPTQTPTTTAPTGE